MRLPLHLLGLLFGSFGLITMNVTNIPLSVSPLFGDYMVLQQQMPVPVWGWAQPSAPLTLAIGNGHAALPPDALCIGNCTAIAAKDHVIVKGCPPVASDILQKLQAAQTQRRSRS